MSKIQVEGVQGALRALKKMSDKDGQAIEEVFRKIRKTIHARADKYVPVQHGRLKASGTDTDNGKKGFGHQSTVEYGGPTAPYAMIVHERTMVPHAPPTCAKYLSRAMRELRGTMTAMLKRQLVATVQGTRPV